MTIFRRRGYWRVSTYGVRHWVSNTTVARDEWDRSTQTPYRSPVSRLRALGAGHSLSSAYVNPNATCPVCGAQVFFYQNESGSKVYFDELGPPWPKHPCTDLLVSRVRSTGDGEITEPSIRKSDDIATIQRLLQEAFLDPAASFFKTYKAKPWAPYHIEWCEKVGSESLLILSRVNDGPASRLFLKIEGFSRRSPVGALVYYARNKLSYFAPYRAKVVVTTVHRVRDAKRFVEMLVERNGASAGRI